MMADGRSPAIELMKLDHEELDLYYEFPSCKHSQFTQEAMPG